MSANATKDTSPSTMGWPVMVGMHDRSVRITPYFLLFINDKKHILYFTDFFSFHIKDVDECASASNNCAHTCTNLPGGYQCSCMSGYYTPDDGISCSCKYHVITVYCFYFIWRVVHNHCNEGLVGIHDSEGMVGKHAMIRSSVCITVKWWLDWITEEWRSEYNITYKKKNVRQSY